MTNRFQLECQISSAAILKRILRQGLVPVGNGAKGQPLSDGLVAIGGFYSRVHNELACEGTVSILVAFSMTFCLG